MYAVTLAASVATAGGSTALEKLFLGLASSCNPIPRTSSFSSSKVLINMLDFAGRNTTGYSTILTLSVLLLDKPEDANRWHGAYNRDGTILILLKKQKFF